MTDWLPVASDLAVVILSVIGMFFAATTLFATILVYGQINTLLRRADAILSKAEVSSDNITSALARRAMRTGGRSLFARLARR